MRRVQWKLKYSKIYNLQQYLIQQQKIENNFQIKSNKNPSQSSVQIRKLCCSENFCI